MYCAKELVCSRDVKADVTMGIRKNSQDREHTEIESNGERRSSSPPYPHPPYTSILSLCGPVDDPNC